MGYVADQSRRFFHPSVINEMLTTFLPQINGTNLDVRQALGPISDFTLINISLEHSCIPVLSSYISAIFPSTILPPHVVSDMGILKLVSVR